MYAFKGKKPYKSWLKDGVNGGPCSMDILVDWLSNQSNYAKWKGQASERIPKKSLLENILVEMRRVGIHHRVAKDIASKISTLQSNYRVSRAWKQIDGEKLRVRGVKEETIHAELVKRFPYWDMLDSVFHRKITSSPMSISSITHSAEEEEVVSYTSLSQNTLDLQKPFLDVESLIQVTREKEAGRMQRSQEMLQFLRDKRRKREQMLLEKELTKRIKAKSELVRNLLEANFRKQDIAEQLNLLS